MSTMSIRLCLLAVLGGAVLLSVLNLAVPETGSEVDIGALVRSIEQSTFPAGTDLDVADAPEV